MAAPIARRLTRRGESGSVTYHLDDTIAAIATAPGGAGRSMVRVSGPAVAEILERSFTARDSDSIAGAQTASTIDGEMRIQLHGVERRVPCTLFYWPNRRSYTREPVAELHMLGSLPVAEAVLDAICNAGARIAQPGEFTLRAFLAGRIDLTQAEAVLGVIDAHDAADLRSAVEQLAGNLAQPLGRMREELLMLLAEVEAGLDFVEEDIEFIAAYELARRLEAIAAELIEITSTMRQREVTKSAGQVALVGAPNAGKSSLFNALVQRFGAGGADTTAIVSATRGTTRDYLVAEVQLAGQRFQLIDTAGVDDAGEPLADVELMARDQTAAQRERSLVRALCIEAAATDFEQRLARAAQQMELIAVTKTDMVESMPVTAGLSMPVVVTSSVSGVGLTEFVDAVNKLLASTTVATRASCVAATAARCHDSLQRALVAVGHAADLARMEAGDELVAAEIRSALGELGKVVGAVYTDDLLDRIFKSFCIGK